MKSFTATVAFVLLLASSVSAQQPELKTDKLVGWMRTIITLEVQFQHENHRYATDEELVSYARTKIPPFAKEIAPSSMAPYTLQITTSAKADHFHAAILRPSDMHDQATWCKTAVFGGDAGLIYLGQNIDCPGAIALEASSKPSK